jgi:hypothetical protein
MGWVLAPGFLRGILSINVETLDRSDNQYWEVGAGKIRNAERKLVPLSLGDGMTLEAAVAAAQGELKVGRCRMTPG